MIQGVLTCFICFVGFALSAMGQSKDLAKLELKFDEALIRIQRTDSKGNKLPLDELELLSNVQVEYSELKNEGPQYRIFIKRRDQKDSIQLLIANGFELERAHYRNLMQKITDKSLDETSYGAFWGEIAQHLKDVKTVYLQTDGVYSCIPLNALYNPKQKHYLIDEVEIMPYLHGREALVEKKSGKDTEPIYIATHGYFVKRESPLPDTMKSKAKKQQKGGELDSASFGSSYTIQSRILAQEDSTVKVDTAKMTYQLDLSNTSLVVFSTEGESTVGNSLLKNGMLSISTLWNVDENIRSEFMNIFYRKIIESSAKNSESREAEAFRESQLEFKKKYTAPFYWAVFVLRGNR